MTSVKNRKIRFAKNGKDWIDETDLIKKGNGKTIDWKKSVGQIVQFGYYGETHELEILDYIVEDGKYMVLTKCNGLIDKTPLCALRNIELARVLGDKKKEMHLKRFSKDGLTIKERVRLKSKQAKAKREQFKRNREKELSNILKEKFPTTELIGEYVTRDKKIGLKCTACNHTWGTQPGFILNGIGGSCPACCMRREVNNYDGRNAIYYTHPDLVRNLVNIQDAFCEALTDSDKKLKTICRDCGNISDKKKSSLLEGFSCDKCSDGISYPNKFIYSVIDQLSKINNITDIKREFKPEWSHGRIYDIKFKYNNIDYIIEMDGGFHYCDNRFNGCSVEEQNHIDMEKDLMAQFNGHELIRIDCNYSSRQKRHEYIKNNIINSKLSKIFDLTVVNWGKVETFAIGSIAAKVWDMINNEFTVNDILSMIPISKSTINGYISIGKKLGIIPRGNSRGNISIWVFKLGKLAWNKPFNNAQDLEYKSLSIFKDRLPGTNVYDRLKRVGNLEHTSSFKGYTFVKVPYGEDINKYMDIINSTSPVDMNVKFDKDYINKVYLEDVLGDGYDDRRISWESFAGMSVRFNYKGVAGLINIVKHIRKKGGNNKLLLNAYGYEFIMSITSFKECRFGNHYKGISKYIIEHNRRNLIRGAG